jgi:hypothetical protein
VFTTSVVGSALRPHDDSVSDWMLDLTKSLTVVELEELAQADTNNQLKILGADFIMEYSEYVAQPTSLSVAF